ncbi:Hypothetical predicted protein [Lecanosticta acicola]|uniref:Uncharacterized protein n=1 Tax=Lecanosticta acicola TaxID=111012 RepID=A0AAI8Z8E4_9PEZI|nr:Hypothetical predicted protein [Lecanosticta acicola]
MDRVSLVTAIAGAPTLKVLISWALGLARLCHSTAQSSSADTTGAMWSDHYYRELCDASTGAMDALDEPWGFGVWRFDIYQKGFKPLVAFASSPSSLASRRKRKLWLLPIGHESSWAWVWRATEMMLESYLSSPRSIIWIGIIRTHIAFLTLILQSHANAS